MLPSVLLACLAIWFLPQSPSPTPPRLDYDVCKSRVQPIFLAKRPGNARCYSCHISGANAYLQKLSPGATGWDDEQSLRNFAAVMRYVVPGAPEKSKLLLHPLDQRAGGDDFHGGGQHWTSRDSPEMQTLAAWVRGETPRDTGNGTTAAASSRSPRAAAAPAARRGVRIVQTNSAGDGVDLIDPATNTVVARIEGIEVNHGAAAAPDGSRLYITNESQSSLDIVDARTLKVVN